MSARGSDKLYRRLEWLYQHPLLFIGTLLVVSIGLILANMYTVANVLTEESAKRYAEQYLNALEQFRSTYSSEIVARLQDRGVEVSQDYRAHEGHIPFPATFSIILSQRISQEELNSNTNLYSDYPWPWRVDGGPRDDFEKAALQTLRANPEREAYSRVEKSGGIRTLRYGKPVIMKQSCVDCHNSMSSSPKKDWEVGDVRGVHAVSMALPVPTSVVVDRFSSTSILMVGGTVISLVLLTLFVRALRQSAQETEAANRALVATNEAFSRFVPHEFLASIQKPNIVDVSLGDSAQKEMTILFSDIRDFTTLSENLNPEENFAFINNYLRVMGPIVREHGGFVDKYIGDAIMALFSSADEALKAAITMLRRLPDCGSEDDGRSGFLKIGVGLNTGHLMLGTIGETDRMEGTVISDAVNVAARIEGLTKTFSAPLLISHTTLKRLKRPGDFRLRCIAHVTVKGKSEPVTVYEVFDTDPEALAAQKSASRESFEEAVKLYEGHDYAGASALFEQCVQSAPDDVLARQYRDRCQAAASGPSIQSESSFWRKVYFDMPTASGNERRVFINCKFRRLDQAALKRWLQVPASAMSHADSAALLREALVDAVIIRRRNEIGEPIQERFTDDIKEWLIGRPYFAAAAAAAYGDAVRQSTPGGDAEPLS